MRTPYSIELTRAEYQAAVYMTNRGYLGEVTTHATDTLWSDDESEVVLLFTEPDAWRVLDVCEADPDAVWALSSPSTVLGAKFQAFLDGII